MKQEFRHKNPAITRGDTWNDIHKTDCEATNPDGSRCTGIVLVMRNAITFQLESAYCLLCGQHYKPRKEQTTYYDDQKQNQKVTLR